MRELNNKIKAEWNSTQIRNWLKANYDISVTRQTIYTHRDEHMTRPEDKIVSAVEKAQRKELMLPRVSSNEQYLEAIRDIGYQRAVENPEEVTIEHSLRAVQIMESSSKRGGGNITILLAKVFTGGESPEVIIEGEARELN